MINRTMIGVVIGVSIITGAWFHGNSYGKQSVEAEYNEALAEKVELSRALADNVDLLNQERTKKAAQKVRTIYVETDPTGCIDTGIPSGLLDTLRREADRSETD